MVLVSSGAVAKPIVQVQGDGTVVSPVSPLPVLDYAQAVGLGLVATDRIVLGLGHNGAVSSVPADIWPGGGVYPWMAAATSLEILSASAADAAAGTGMRTGTISGLDANYAQISDVLTLNGTTAVALPRQYLRINSLVGATAGSGAINAGQITVRDAGGGTTRCVMEAGYGTARQSQFTVPAGFTLSIQGITLSINRPTSQRDCTVASYVRLFGAPYRLALELSVDGNPFQGSIPPGATFPEKTDFGFRCTYVSQTNTDITAFWQGLLRKVT